MRLKRHSVDWYVYAPTNHRQHPGRTWAPLLAYAGQFIKIITDKYISNKENFVDELVKLLKEVNAENVSKESIEKMYVSLLEISKRDMEFYSRYAVQLIFLKFLLNR